ncbi:MAG TPA: DUF3667 domain-containing protein [Sphingomicrobium sp.]|nr:DUF3667 domain-containing protein [Sphingomicrobium sp.]
MVGEFEALGDAVIGAVVGRAVEPKAGEGDDGHTHEENCLNCGTELTGNYCHACGQHAHVHRTLGAFFHDFLHGVLHFEGKIWRTLPLLAWKPGELTRRYVDGQRASFVSPIALFLFCVFLMFAVVSMLGGVGEFSPEAKKDMASELAADKRKLATLQQQRDGLSGPAAAKLDQKIADQKVEITAVEAVSRGEISSKAIDIDPSGLAPSLSDAVKKARKNPELVAYKLKTNAYKFSWLIIPLSVPFVWLLFPFSRRFRLYDHTIFVTYSLCFMTLLVVAGILFQSVGLTSIAGLLWLLPPFHMYRQLKGAYGLSRRGAIWRTILLTMFALIVVSLFAALLVGMGTFE